MRSFHSICILKVHFNIRCECNPARTRDACQCWVWITNEHTQILFLLLSCVIFLCHTGYTENKHSFANTIWPRSASTDLKHKCPHPMPEGGNMMEARAPFLSTALPTDLEPSGAKTQSTAGLQRPFTSRSPLQTDRIQESFSPLYPVSPCRRLASLWAAPGHHTLAYPHGGLALVCWMLTKRQMVATSPSFGQLPISVEPQRCPVVMGVV